MAIHELLSATNGALYDLRYAAQQAAQVATADRETMQGLLDSDDFNTVSANNEDVRVLAEDVRRTLDEDRQRSENHAQELAQAAQEWEAAINALHQLASGPE